MSVGTVIRKYGRLTILVVFFVGASFLVYQLGDRLFDLQNIEVKGQGINVVVDQNRIPKNLLFFPENKLREKILEDNPMIADVSFTKKLPHTLVITATLRLPIARLNSAAGEIGLSGNGIILPPPAPGQTLPLLSFQLSTAKFGDRVADLQILTSLSFIDKTKSFLILLSVQPLDSASLLAKTSKTDIIFAQDGDVNLEVATLQTLLAGFRIKGNLPTKIDLRFAKPIVTF